MRTEIEQSSRPARLQHALRALALCALVFAPVGCASRMAFVTANPAEDGHLEFVLAEPGVTRVVTRRDEDSGLWQQIVLSNAGPRAVRGIELWGSGGLDLLQLDASRSGETGGFTPFALIPGQTLSLFCDRSGVQGDGTLLGNSLWELPRDPAIAKAAFLHSANAAPQPEGTLLLSGSQGRAFAEWQFESPYPLSAARVIWSQFPERPIPKVWISLDGKAWGSIEAVPGQKGVQPVDLSSTVKGHAGFRVRLELSDTPRDRVDLLLSGLMIEAEFQAPAKIREWRPGLNEITLRRKGAAETPLQVWFPAE